MSASRSAEFSAQLSTSGQSAVAERREYAALSPPDYRKYIEGWVSRGATGAAVSDLHATDDLTADGARPVRGE